MASEQENTDELLFRCEWEIGVNEAGDVDDWDHYHPRAHTASEARELAIEDARSDGYTDPCVYMVSGPYPPENPATVGREMIDKVFGDE